MTRLNRTSFFLALLVVASASIAFTVVEAADADPVLDFCVADPKSTCKDPAKVTKSDFVFTGLAKPGNPNNEPSGAATSFAFVDQFPALNTMGISMVRIAYAEGGLVNLHTHPRASELLYLVEGKLYVGFVGASDNKLYDAVLNAGDACIVPRGLVHFSLNVGKGPAYAVASFNSQNPGAQFIPPTLFGSSNITDTVLAQGFGITEMTVESLKAQFKAKFG